MSLDKSIQHGKEHRKPYHKAGRHDRSCRPGGSCPWCQTNRQHSNERRKTIACEQIQDAAHDIKQEEQP
jgi:hypothetical protein